MLYFTLARRTGAVLLTFDKKFLALAEKEGIGIIKLIDGKLELPEGIIFRPPGQQHL